jgi:hypothetical protein
MIQSLNSIGPGGGPSAIDIVGCVASVIGLIVSAFALLAARSARVAAEEARDAVYKENLKQELGEMSVLAEQMLSAIKRRDSAVVASAATTLLGRTEHAISRWGHYLKPEQRAKLIGVPELIASLNRTVVVKDIPLDEVPLRRMVDQCQNVLRTMNSALGSIQIDSESANE